MLRKRLTIELIETVARNDKFNLIDIQDPLDRDLANVFDQIKVNSASD